MSDVLDIELESPGMSAVSEKKSKPVRTDALSLIDFGVVCPMANEIDTAVPFAREVLKVCDRFPFKSLRFFAILDTVSKDGTLESMRRLAEEDPRVIVIYAPENKRAVDAYVRGYKAALDEGCDWVCEMDAGFSHRPEDIPHFIDKMLQGYDAVFASRYAHGGRFTKVHWKRYLISLGGTIMTNIVARTRLSDMTSGFQLFSARTLRYIVDQGLTSRGPFFQTEMKIHAHKFNISEVGIQYHATPNSIGGSELWKSLQCLWRLRKTLR